MTLKDFLVIIRPQQWYKNFVIFLAIIFSHQLFNPGLFLSLVVGFFVLCITSAANYIINDIIDIERDRIHPEKRNKPIASGRVGKKIAFIYAISLMVVSLVLSFWLNLYFGLCVVALLVGVLIYSLLLKNIIILDVMSISVFFVIRVIAGVVLISVFASPWLILGTFLLALLLATGKRLADLKILGDHAKQHKKVFMLYNEKFLNALISVIVSALILSYSLYIFQRFSESFIMIATIPIAIFMIFRYMAFLFVESKISRNTEKIFKDPFLIGAAIVWLIIIVTGLYI